MKNHATSAGKKPSRKESRTRTVKAGSVTVRIYENLNRGKTSYVVYWRIGEKPERKMFFDLAAAKTFAKDTAEALAAGQVDDPSVSVAEAQMFREAMRVAGHLGIPLHMIAQEYAAAHARLAGVATILEASDFFVRNSIRSELQRTVPEVLEEFIASKRQDNLSDRYVTDTHWRLKRFAAAFKIGITHIRTRDIEDWLRSLGVGARTRNNYRTLISTMFTYARKRGYLPKDRAHEVVDVERPKVRGGAIQVFTPSELAEMMAVAEGQAAVAVAIGAFAGVRSAEILRLNWEDFNWEEDVIDLGCDQTKTASRRLAPILPALRAWLEPHKKPHGPVLRYSLPVCLAEAFKSVAKKVTVRRQEADPEAAPFVWKHNALRHSYASYRMAEVQDAAKVSLEMGNSPQKIFNNYRKVVTKSQAAAWFGVMPTAPENVVPISAVA